MPRKIIRSLRIDEISAVDRPAQVGARFTLMKRAGDTSAHDDNPVTKETPMDGQDKDTTGAKPDDASAAKIARMERIIALNADERAHFDTLKGDDADGFLDMSEADRSKVVTNAAEADEVVFKSDEGQVFRKSDGAVGYTLKRQAEVIAKMQADTEHATLTKRADTVLAKHIGTTDEKAALLKAIDGIPDDATRQRAHEIVKAGPIADATMRSFGSTGALKKSADADESGGWDTAMKSAGITVKKGA